MLNDESDDDTSDSGSAGTCDFTFHFDESVGRVGDSIGRVDDSVGHVSGMGYGIFPWQELSQLMALFRWLCLYQKESSPNVVDS